MPESAVVDQPAGSDTTGSNQQQQSPGWLAGLPADLRDNEAFKPYKTVGDFAKAHLETATRAKEYEGKLANSIPKLSATATPEEREKFFNSLGRPEKPDGYKFVEEDKSAPEWNKHWKTEMHKLGISGEVGTALSKLNHDMWTKVVEEHNAKILRDNAEAATKLKTEWGDKYDANVELVSRLWKRETDSDLDKVFAGETSANRVTMMRFLMKIAAKTGEDTSSRGAGQRTEASKPGYDLSVFKLPPARV